MYAVRVQWWGCQDSFTIVSAQDLIDGGVLENMEKIPEFRAMTIERM